MSHVEAALQVGAARYADVISALDAEGLPTVFTQTGGMCAALEVRLEGGRTLLIADYEDSLAWTREAHYGWTVGLYPRESEYDEGPLVYLESQDGSTASLLMLVQNILRTRLSTD